MQLTKSIALLAIAFTGLVFGGPTSGISLKPGYLHIVGDEAAALNRTYPVGVATWQGTHNGKYYELQGNIGQVIEQLEVLDPGGKAVIRARSAEFLEEAKVARRATEAKTSLQCLPINDQGSWTFGSWDDLNGAIADLKAMGGCLAVAQSDCVTISCTNVFTHAIASGVTMCNDNTHAICPSAAYLASYAQDINDHCKRDASPSWFHSGGQEFDSDRYNVITHLDCIA